MTRLVLVPLDGSPLADSALPRAAHLARALGASLHLVRVHIPVIAYATAESAVAIPDPALDDRIREIAQSWLVKKAAELKTSLKLEVTFEMRVGAPSEEVVAAAKERHADYIVCTTHGAGGWAPNWLGSVADGIIRHSACPVLAMSKASVEAPLVLDRILVPLDGSELSAAILPFVREIAATTDATIDLYRVVSPPWAGDVLNALESNQVDRFGIDPTADVAKIALDRTAEDLVAAGLRATATVEVATNPTRAILERIEATKPDLVAMSNHGRGLSRLFMGSVADKVLRGGGRPVLSWRAPKVYEEKVKEPRMYATGVSGPA
ncbi:MAG: universal stress protein [Gemmatimonadaceae bacterium]|nr:universal stress protein [Gemmatimonadaceae bacterium]